MTARVSDGTAEVSFDIPGFTGTVRVMAVAGSGRGAKVVREAEGREPNEKPDGRVRQQVERAAEPDVAAGAAETAEAELEPEEEEQEDDPELGHELGDVGGSDQARQVGLVWPQK